MSYTPLKYVGVPSVVISGQPRHYRRSTASWSRPACSVELCGRGSLDEMRY